MRCEPHTRFPSPWVSAILAAGLGLLFGTPAGAPIVPRAVLKSFFIDSHGKTASQPYASDTDILLTYAAGLAGMSSGSGASAALYLYDATGEPLTSGTGEVVCAPCMIAAGGAAPRRVSVSVEDLVLAHGGYGTSTLPKQGSLVLDIPSEADHLSAEVRIRTTHGTPGQPTLVPIQPRNILKGHFENGDIPEVWVVPKLDGVSDWETNDWAILDATYLGGIGSVPAGAGATLELYLFNEDGSPTGGVAAPVCAPCTYALGNGGGSGGARSVQLRFPPIPTASTEGFAVVRVAGADPSSVVLEETGIDSIPGPIPMLVVAGSRELEPLPPAETVAAVGQPDVPGVVLALHGSPNPAAGEMTFSFDLARAATSELDVFDAAGRHVATLGSGSRAAGHHELRWNRRDAAGRPLAAGVYYGRLRAGDGSRMTRVVFLPE